MPSCARRLLPPAKPPPRLADRFAARPANRRGRRRPGGRIRATIENEGFNVQKNSGFNWKLAYSPDGTKARACYFLRQLGRLFFQLLEKGSLLENRLCIAAARAQQFSL
jgi:hypothetical protein